MGRYENWKANNATTRHANSRPGWILIRDDDGRDFGWLKRAAPRGPSADADRLLAWRLDSGLTQTAAGKLLKCSSSTISKYERSSDPIPEKLVAKLAKLAGAAG